MKNVDLKPYPKQDECPCGSGKIYQECCISQSFKYEIDSNGDVFRTQRLPNEVEPILESLKNQFYKIFGRRQEEDDPVFPHMLLMPREEYFNNIDEILGLIDAAPEIKYAYRKTGFILTEMNEEFATKKDLEDWSNAIWEFRAKKRTRRTKLQISVQKVIDEFENTLLTYALILFKQQSVTERVNLDEGLNKIDYLLFCLTKHVKTMKSLVHLLDGNFSEDALILTRSLYENYLNTVYLLKNPETFISILKAKVGLKTGKYKYLITKKGKEDKRMAINLKTNELIELDVTSFKKAESTGVKEDVIIFDYLYSFLSSFTHPDILSSSSYVNENGFSFLEDKRRIEAIITSTFVNVVYIDTIKNFDFIGKTTIRDINFLLSKIVKNLIYVISKSSLPIEFINRLKKILPPT